MSWMLSVWVSAALLALCGGQNTEGMHLASSGYHLCIRNETRTVSFLVVQTVPYTVSVPCGGWFFWKTCTVTLHKLVHQTENKTVNEQVTRCCDGYAQVGRYCALSVNRSDEFTAKPGSCPTADGFSSSSKGCVLDIDCPGWQKCCHYLCTDPASSANYSEDGRNTLNATVTVKVDYKELMARDGGLLTHTRLLQAMVTGALQSEVSVRYLDSQPVHPYRTATSLLIDYNFTLSRHNVTSKLSHLLKHIEEVTSVTVEDIDECAHSALHHCSLLARCINTVSSYQCACLQGYTDVDPSNPGANCTGFGFTTESPLTHLPPMNVTYYTASNATQHLPSPPPPWTGPVTPTNVSSTQESPLPSTTCPPPSISNLQPANVTGTSFCVYWSSQFHPNQTYLVEIHNGSEVVLSQETNQTIIEQRHLLPGVLYNVTVTPCACGSQGVALHIAIKTDAQTLEGTARLTNIQFTEDLQNTSSQAYKNLTDSFIQEIYRSLSPEMRALVDSGQIMIKINSISMGSVVVNFTIILSSSPSQDIMNVSTALLYSLKNSSVYTVEVNSTSINDVNECASGENDCHPWATCTNTFGSYTCRCTDGFTDNSPERPGRVCEAIATLETTTPAVTTAVTHAITTSTTAITTTTPSSSTSPIITTTSTNPTITTTTPTTTPTTTTTPASSTSPIITSTSTITSTLTHLPSVNVTYYTASNATQDLPSPPPPWTGPVTPTNVSSTQESPLPSTTCPPPSISNLQPANVTGTSFCVYWSSQFHSNQTYLVEIRNGSEVVLSQETDQTIIEQRDLLPGVLYNVTVTPCACGSQGVALHIAIKTDAQTLEGTARLTNIQFTEDLQNTSSQAYKNLTDSFIQEIYRSLSPEMRALVDSGQIMIKINSISMGSVVVNFTIILSSSQSQDLTNVSLALLYSLKNSSVYTVDGSSTSIDDFNECASGENDCHPWATCTNTFGSYTCHCTDGFTDNTPERPGRVCEAIATLETTTPAVTTAVTHATTTSTTAITTTTPSSSTSPIITTISTTTSTSPIITTTTPTTTPTTTTTPASSTSPIITSTSTITSTTPTTTTTTPTTTPTTTATPSSNPIITTTPTTASTTTTTTIPITSTAQTSTSTTPTTISTTTTTTTTPTTSTSPTTTTTPTTSTAPTTTTTTSLRSPTNASILWALSVQCRVAAITVTVAKDFLTIAHIQESALYLGEQDCGVNGSNVTHVQLTVSWDECGTMLVHNETHYVASVTLFNNMDPYTSQSGSVEVPRRELQVPIMCTYKKSMLISADFSSMGYGMIKDVIMGSGSFQVVVQLMNGTVPLPYNYTLSPKEPVVVEVSLNISSDQIKLIVNKCWATPTPNPADTFSYTFLENSCSLNSYTKVLMNGNSTTSRVSVEIFSFISLNVIYLHCQVQICLQTGLDACVPDCLQRTAWSANTIGTGFGSSGPVLRSAEESFEEEFNTLHIVGLSCLGIGLTLFFIIGFVCLFYYQRNRIGHYNFSVKPKEENFTYLVFNT